MADLEKTVQIIFEAIDNITGPLSDMSSSLSDFGGDATNVSDDADTLSEAITGIPAEVDINMSTSGDVLEEVYGFSDALDGLEDVSVNIGLDGVGEFEGVFDALSDNIKETGDEIDQLFEDNPSQLSQLEADQWSQAITDDMEKKQADFDLQKKLVDQQLELLEAKQRAVEGGEGLIKIDSTGLEPVLEEILWQILEKVQIRAVETKPEFLLGLPV